MSSTKTMTAWAVAEHAVPLQKIELPIPEPTGTEILIKVNYCGVCHSDLHFWEGFYEVKSLSYSTTALPFTPPSLPRLRT
jgi:D-arabinose 1-dehydrogenase-like Zn-dependent alcohol dehydrogenase